MLNSTVFIKYRQSFLELWATSVVAVNSLQQTSVGITWFTSLSPPQPHYSAVHWLAACVLKWSSAEKRLQQPGKKLHQTLKVKIKELLTSIIYYIFHHLAPGLNEASRQICVCVPSMQWTSYWLLWIVGDINEIHYYGVFFYVAASSYSKLWYIFSHTVKTTREIMLSGLSQAATSVADLNIPKGPVAVSQSSELFTTILRHLWVSNGCAMLRFNSIPEVALCFPPWRICTVYFWQRLHKADWAR